MDAQQALSHRQFTAARRIQRAWRLHWSKKAAAASGKKGKAAKGGKGAKSKGASPKKASPNAKLNSKSSTATKADGKASKATPGAAAGRLKK